MVVARLVPPKELRGADLRARDAGLMDAAVTRSDGTPIS
jgi:hypothetical protein